ncbi:efflux transporter outer membrane subunit [Variovorax sp. dw_308]|uniref:efflux transporter outer membrane subunit n=1 Tax=Variovorax sp. dw_308 TaxID=2721546 RepID=UPI001C45C137|nr:efflux transporter outer membrane subunit [Variovorax sp. dw_308]
MTLLPPDSLAMKTARRGTVVAAAALALLLAGCAEMGHIDSAAQMRDAAALDLPAQAAPEVTVASQWWLAFGDTQLNALVDQALQGNPNLQVAQARIARARAQSQVVGAAELPQVGAGLDLTRQLFSETYIYPPPLGGSIQETGTLQLNGSWEIDFFGKNRSALNAAIGATNAAAADADAARVLLASNVVRGYLQWARWNDQLVVAKRTLAQREETLRLVRDRVSAGLDTRLQLRQSEGGIPEARQQMEAITEQIALSQHALDALVGQPNATANLKSPELTAIKNIALQPVLPADLLGRRADIAAARWRVEAATQDVKNAKTQFYPNVNLVAFAGFQSIGVDSLLKSASQQWGIGPAIRLPIFEGGRLRANLRGKSADLDASIESYNTTVLDAVRDVADSVTSVQSVVRQQAQQREAQAAAESAYDIAMQRYGAGLGNFLDVLSAETTVLLQRRQGVDLAARALDTQVGLARALGGGWQPTPETSTAALVAPNKIQ